MKQCLAEVREEAVEYNVAFQKLDIDAGKKLLAEKDVIIVDIRDLNAYSASHIENARHINDGNVQEFLRSTDKAAPLLVYCYHGNSSQGAAEFFSASGFVEVYSLDGGFESWRTKYPVISPGS